MARLHYGHVDPREAGVGNIVNCGAAMYMAPVGIANAGDPDGAYAEAIDIAGRASVAATAGRRPVSSPPPSPPRCARAPRRQRSSTPRCGWPRTAPAAAIEAICEAAANAARRHRRRDLAAAGRWRRSTRVGEDYRDPGLGARRPAGCTRSRNCRSRWAASSPRGGDYRRAVLGGDQLRPGLRLDRDHGRRALRRPARHRRDPGGVARSRRHAAAAST